MNGGLQKQSVFLKISQNTQEKNCAKVHSLNQISQLSTKPAKIDYLKDNYMFLLETELRITWLHGLISSKMVIDKKWRPGPW